ncbi:MAG: transglycosylase SLT domain-containing protein [Chloroflexi bacterium]|nr:transglycosylase SLT domain-containing protein [Chloroflexota bacterium]
MPFWLVRALPFLLSVAVVASAVQLGGVLSKRIAATPDLQPFREISGLPTIFTPEVQRWSPEIQAWAAAYDLPAPLIATVMQIESCGDPQARSGAGAQGLFQVMPFHFAPDEAALEPETNARRGLAYLARALELAGGRVDLALAGYNGGHSRITQPPDLWPDETRRYVAWGSAIYADAAAGKAESPALEAWLQAGGARLCRTASTHDA